MTIRMDDILLVKYVFKQFLRGIKATLKEYF